LPAFRVRRDGLAQIVFTDAALACDAGHLKLGSSRRDVRIESRTGCGYQIDRYRLAGVFLLQLFDVSFYAIDKLLIGWTKVRDTRWS
jgi:hypothetical protein